MMTGPFRYPYMQKEINLEKNWGSNLPTNIKKLGSGYSVNSLTRIPRTQCILWCVDYFERKVRLGLFTVRK